MPYQIVKRSGSRPWKIIKKTTGEVVGSSTSKKDAEISISYREHGRNEIKKKVVKRKNRRIFA